jgi:hypothetical protein
MRLHKTHLSILKKLYGIVDMAQELRTINLNAPAFKGINTEDSPLAQDTAFADIADNAVIDKRGRIAARKGYDVFTADNTALGGNTITAIGEFKDDSGERKIFLAGNNKIWSADPDEVPTLSTLTDETPAGYSITDNNWKMVNFNDRMYLFQKGYEPLVYEAGTVNDLLPISQTTGAAGTLKAYGNEVLAAYGRLWVADFGADRSTVYWSDLLIANDFNGGTSGSIDVSKVWPDGYDEIVSLAAHNGLLIIFGNHSIVVYQGAQAPASMRLVDTVTGVGCVDRDTVQYTGTDVLFLSYSGLRSFGRTLQQESMPLQSLSASITRDIIDLLSAEVDSFRSVYSPEFNFYLLTFVGQNTTYCFDVRGQVENGAYRVTRWPSSVFTAYTRTDDGELLIGTTDGLSEYRGYTDNGESYRFNYVSPRLTFGDSSRVKLLKKIKPTIIGGNTTDVFLKWSYDFSDAFTRLTLPIETGAEPAYFSSGLNEPGTSFYGVNKYSSGVNISRLNTNATGYGTVVSIGLETDINGVEFSVQEINVLALLGKTL